MVALEIEAALCRLFCLFVFYFIEKRSRYVAQAGLEFVVTALPQPLSAGIVVMSYFAWFTMP